MKKHYLFNDTNNIDSSWHTCIEHALAQMNPTYLDELENLASHDWLPGSQCLFNAFSLPVNQVSYVLLGESPYPRAASANGYAFWDAAVSDLWSDTGFSKPVNRATSLRNLIKMLLVAANQLHPPHITQNDIAKLDKSHLVKSSAELFGNFLKKGFLLLNASLVLRQNQVKQDAQAWQPFLRAVFEFLLKTRSEVKFILLGNIAKIMDKIIAIPSEQKFIAEHPYNISFIQNPTVLAFFKPLKLLEIGNIKVDVATKNGIIQKDG
jgi:uracil-DNA glycosylase